MYGERHRAERMLLWPQGWRHVLPPTPLKKALRPDVHLALYLFDELLQQGRQDHACSHVTGAKDAPHVTLLVSSLGCQASVARAWNWLAAAQVEDQQLVLCRKNY